MSPVKDPAPIRQRMSKEARRSQLLANAEVVFGEVGYSGATVEEIAARSGVARSLLYEHFDSLDELYLECMRAARAELDRRFLAAAIVPGGPLDRMHAGIYAYFTFVKERGTGWDVLFGSTPTPTATVGKIAAELRFRTVEQIAALFTAELPDLAAEDALAYAHAVSGAGEQVARWWRQNPQIPLEAVVERMMTIVWGGMRELLEQNGVEIAAPS
jgi:AcrR family transcriptional regulator